MPDIELEVISGDKSEKHCHYHERFKNSNRVTKIYDIYAFKSDGKQYVPACKSCLVKLLQDKNKDSNLYIPIFSLVLDVDLEVEKTDHLLSS